MLNRNQTLIAVSFRGMGRIHSCYKRTRGELARVRLPIAAGQPDRRSKNAARLQRRERQCCFYKLSLLFPNKNGMKTLARPSRNRSDFSRIRHEIVATFVSTGCARTRNRAGAWTDSIAGAKIFRWCNAQPKWYNSPRRPVQACARRQIRS